VAIGCGGLLAVVLLLWLARAPILTGMAEFLTVEDSVAQADVIFVFAGEAYVRPTRAAELYGQGVAPVIVIPRPEDGPAQAAGVQMNPTDASVLLMERLGVPRTSIVTLTVLGGSTSTIEDARLFRPYVERNGIRRVIAVTSNFHTRRARWVLRRALDGLPVDIRMAGANDPRYDERSWWKTESGLIAYVEEYLKWVQNRFQW
jgi:uncharacterized SAM-binding protein YcdF (DUF218 family)